MVTEFDITLPRRTVSGPGAVVRLGELAAEHGKHALLCIGGGSVKRTGTLEKAQHSLAQAGVRVTLFEGIEPDPSVETCERGREVCREAGCDVVIGLGGGSVMDCAKIIAIAVANEGPVEDYQFNRRRFERPGLPYIAVSTTSGTGSEANRVGVLTHHGEKVKKAVLDPLMVPAVAILDPELTVSVPPEVTRYTGIDALSHAIESYVSLNATPFTEGIGLRAVELIARYLPVAVAEPANLEARAAMQVANYLGGMALNAGVGAAHILAHPLGALFGIPHGTAIACVLPSVMRHNAEHAPEKYARLAEALGAEVAGLSTIDAARRASEALERFLERIAFRPRLSEFGVSLEAFDEIYASKEKSMGHVKTNPRPATAELLRQIIEESL